MAKDKASTRRAFLKVGALAAAPLAAAASAEAMAAESHKARLLRLQDEAAVRDLHQAWLRRVNAGEDEAAARLFADPRRAALPEGLSAVGADHAAEPGRIEFAADGRTASGRFPCVVEIQTPLAKDCTLAQMAHAQGSGVVRRSERRVLEAAYVKAGDRWAIGRLELKQA
jgi:hypothetical protein